MGYQLLEKTFLPGNQEYISTFGEYAGLAFQTFLMVVIVLAIGMLTVSGLQYIISPAAGGKEEATKRIWAAITGLLIALSAYLILNTINPNLVGASLDLGNIGTITPPVIDPGTPGGGGGTDPGNTGGTGGSHQYPSGVGLTEDEARNQLADKNVKINNDGRICGGLTYDQYKVQHNGLSCTNLDGLSQESIDQIIQLKRDCNCEVMITGGTEAGHSAGGTYGAHAPGGTAIDINRNGNTALDNYIQSGTYLGLSGNRPIYQIGGRKYWREDSAHWHSY
jgi:hypothetical protein